MYDLALTKTEKKLYEQALLRDHRIKIVTEIYTLDHKYPNNISDLVLEGQITIEASAQITTRNLSMTILDPYATLGFDSGDPQDGALFVDRMLRVRYDVYVRELKRWIGVPVFMGPVTKLDRSGSTIRVEAQGKEVLAKTIWTSFSIAKGTNKATAIKTIMDKAGETHYSLHKTTGKLPNKLSLAYSKEYWTEARRIASTLNHYMYYNGAGRLITKPYPENSTYTFTDGDYGALLTEPEISYDPESIRNVVRVVGKKPKKGKAPQYTAVANSTELLSPNRLGRAGTKRYIPEVIQSDSYRSVAECKKRALSFLETRLKSVVDVKFDSLVIPHLEPNDMCTLKTGKIGTTFRLSTFTIPLTPNGVMTVGYSKSQTIYKSKIRRK